jgi:methylenetetrahydrofolate dehydrogenase (NADP+)/methenyltetrahydrofolate cyclohydrolase
MLSFRAGTRDRIRTYDLLLRKQALYPLSYAGCFRLDYTVCQMLLSGSQLAGFIKVRQTRQAQQLRHALGQAPKLVIIQAKSDPAIDTYVKLKRRYGEAIGVEVEVAKASAAELLDMVKRYGSGRDAHGIIVQLPLPDSTDQGKILNAVKPSSDVDGLGARSEFDSASATAILWLLAGYGVELAGKHIVVVGQGRLVGAPLTAMLRRSGHDVTACDSKTENLSEEVARADLLISATGVPRLIKAGWLKQGAVAVDAGTADEQGALVGDLDDAVYERDDLKLTPKKGGVGPLTVCALFENLLRAAQNRLNPKR